MHKQNTISNSNSQDKPKQLHIKTKVKSNTVLHQSSSSGVNPQQTKIKRHLSNQQLTTVNHNQSLIKHSSNKPANSAHPNIQTRHKQAQTTNKTKVKATHQKNKYTIKQTLPQQSHQTAKQLIAPNNNSYNQPKVN